jgi:hypothetical protein
MAALPMPKYQLRLLNLFPEYGSREDYQKATGLEPPPYSPNRPLKLWFDPEAAKSIKRTIYYDRVLAVSEIGLPIPGPDGKPFLEPLVLPKNEAATVNIPAYKSTPSDQVLIPVPVPVRALEPEEELDFAIEGVVVRNKAWVDANWGSGYTEKDRQLLQAIARKLNVTA